MKILLLTDSFNYCCGRSRHISLLVRYLKSKGNDVFVIYGGGDAGRLLDSDEIPNLENQLFLHKNRTYLNYLRAISFIYKLQKKNHFDLIHAHHHYASSIAGIAAIITRTPLLMTIHGAVERRGKLSFYTGNYFIAVSNSTKEFAISNVPKIKNQIEVVYNGIEYNKKIIIDNNQFRNKLGIEKDSIIISMIGRIVEHKGHNILLSAISKLNENRNITCLIVGEGDYVAQIKKLSASYNFKILFIDSVPEPDPYFNFSDIIVVPSLCCEGLPISLLEAGKFSKPVIASNIEGIKEVIIHGVNGYLINPGDTEELKKYLKILLSDKDKRLELGLKLNQTISDMFSVETMVDKTLKIYNKMIKKKTG
jgi:glycosyltransferase involved in cell wall biosynthesis